MIKVSYRYTGNPLPEEMELIRTKEDAILENAEIVGYQMVMHIAQRTGAQDIYPSWSKT